MMNNMQIIIKEIISRDEKAEITERILRSLPDWFELEDGVISYINGVKNKNFFAAIEDGNVLGFVAVEDHNKHSSEIYVMGVLPEYRHKGVGQKMINHIWNRNIKTGRKYLVVKTLDESSDDKFYEETRDFYRRVGFLPLFSTTELWGEDNPCLIMVKS